MKIQHLFLVSLPLLLMFNSCKKESYRVPTRYDDGIQEGEVFVVNDGQIGYSVNVEGGMVEINGNTKVSADINVTDSRSDVIIKGHAEVHRINMEDGTNGEIYLSGSPVIKTDFNVNQGSVIVGDVNFPHLTDTVRILNNLNLYGTLHVNAGVLIVENDLNHFGDIFIADGAELIIGHQWNQNGDVYGSKNLTSNGHYNYNSGEKYAEPFVDQE